MAVLTRAAKWLAVLFFVIGSAFWIRPSLSNRTVWFVSLWASLIASALVALSNVPHWYLGWLMTEPPRGRIFGRLALVDFASESSATRRFIYFIPISLLVIGLAWKTGLLSYGIVLIAAWLAPEIYYLVMRMTPPLVLFLGASEPLDPHRSAALMSVVLVGKRLVTLLRPDQRAMGPSYSRMLSYRTHDDVWVDMLDELLELAPVIAIDLRCETEAVSFEIDRVLTRRFGYKTVVLVGANQVSDYEDVLRLVTRADGVCVTEFDALSYVLRAFCHPVMPLPTIDRSIAALVGDMRRENPHVDFAVWGQPVPPPRGDINPGKRYVVG